MTGLALLCATRHARKLLRRHLEPLQRQEAIAKHNVHLVLRASYEPHDAIAWARIMVAARPAGQRRATGGDEPGANYADDG